MTYISVNALSSENKFAVNESKDLKFGNESLKSEIENLKNEAIFKKNEFITAQNSILEESNSLKGVVDNLSTKLKHNESKSSEYELEKMNRLNYQVEIYKEDCKRYMKKINDLQTQNCEILDNLFVSEQKITAKDQELELCKRDMDDLKIQLDFQTIPQSNKNSKRLIEIEQIVRRKLNENLGSETDTSTSRMDENSHRSDQLNDLKADNILKGERIKCLESNLNKTEKKSLNLAKSIDKLRHEKNLSNPPVRNFKKNSSKTSFISASKNTNANTIGKNTAPLKKSILKNSVNVDNTASPVRFDKNQ